MHQRLQKRLTAQIKLLFDPRIRSNQAQGLPHIQEIWAAESGHVANQQVGFV